jgi:hypothetical protein
MSRYKRARYRAKTAPAATVLPPLAPEVLGDKELEPNPTRVPTDDKPAPKRSRLRLVDMPTDPDLARYRSQLNEQLAARRDGKPTASLTTITAPKAARTRWRMPPRLWIASFAASVVTVASAWWLSTALSPGEANRRVEMAMAPPTRASAELTQAEQALQQERDKAEKLTLALSAAWRELSAQAVALADKTAQEQELNDLRQALQESESSSASHAQLLAQERSQNYLLEQQLAARRNLTPAPSLTPAPVPTEAPILATNKPAARPPTASETPAAPTQDRPAPVVVQATAPTPDGELPRLMARAGVLLALGDIGAARSVLERAAEIGSAQALFALAETFDPAVLSAWGTFGTQGDVAKAQELYAKAFAGGVQEAKDRLVALLR